MISTRFTSKVLLVTVVPVITTALILAFILISGRVDEFNKRINEKGSNIASYLSPVSEYGIFSNNFSYLESTLSYTLKQPDIVAIFIEDDKKSIILEKTSKNWKGIDIKNIDKKNNKIFKAVIIKTSIKINDLEPAIKPNSNNNIFLGTINVVMNLNNAKTNKFRIIKNGIFITLLLTFVTMIIALLFARSITRPINSINTGVNIIKKGGLNYRIPIDFHGELADLARGINNMTSSLETAQFNEKQRAENELYNEQTKAHITLEALGEGVITTDTNGKITYLNPAAEKLTGFSLDRAINKYISKVFNIKHHHNKSPSNYHIMDCIKSSNKTNHDSGYLLSCNDGTQYAIKETATPLLDKQGNLIGAVLVFHDFTNIKKVSDVYDT